MSGLRNYYEIYSPESDGSGGYTSNYFIFSLPTDHLTPDGAVFLYTGSAYGQQTTTDETPTPVVQPPSQSLQTNPTETSSNKTASVFEGIKVTKNAPIQKRPNTGQTVSDVSWTNAKAILDTSPSEASKALQTDVYSTAIQVGGFNFHLPTDATIEGIEVEVKARVLGGSLTSEKVQLQNCEFVTPAVFDSDFNGNAGIFSNNYTTVSVF